MAFILKSLESLDLKQQQKQYFPNWFKPQASDLTYVKWLGTILLCLVHMCCPLGRVGIAHTLMTPEPVFLA